MQISRSFVRVLAVSLAAAFLSLSACHDAPRENPLDPQLTPPVELTVALDDTAGTATLTWTPYAGAQPFAEYQVLRNVSRSTVVDTLARFTALGDTLYRDTTLSPDTAYEYRVAVVNGSGFEVASALQRVDGYTTRAVHLLPLVIEPESGTVRLTWTRYRDPGFAQYRVLRRQVGTDQEEELASRSALSDTTWTDNTAQHQVDYSYSIVVEAAGQSLHSLSREGRLELPAVTVQATFDSPTATAAVTWGRYRGPRFAGYRLERITGVLEADETASKTVHQSADLQDTAFVDSLLNGDTHYTYQVTVVTQANERVTGLPQGGRFHQWEGEWSLQVGEGGQTRLYWEDGTLVALVADLDGIRLLEFSTDGMLRHEQVLLGWPIPALQQRAWGPPLQSVSMARLPDGTRLLSLIDKQTDHAAVLTFNPAGIPHWVAEEQVYMDTVAGPVESQPSYLGNCQVGAAQTTDYSQGTRLPGAYTTIPLLEVSIDGQPVLAGQQFADPDQWTRWTRATILGDGELLLQESYNEFGYEVFLPAQREYEGKWNAFEMRVQFSLMRGALSLGIGPNDPAWTDERVLRLDLGSGMQLYRRRLDAIAARKIHTTILHPSFSLVPYVPYQVRLEANATTSAIWLAHAMHWHQPVEATTSLVSLAASSGSLLTVVGSLPTWLEPGSPERELPILAGPVSEIRSWSRTQSGREIRWIGLCLPEQHRVMVGALTTFTGGFVWPFTGSSVASLGRAVGQDPGELVFPVSFALGPDHRFFVLDAGNARVEVFRRNGDYITQWGRRGSGPGEFDLGSGASVSDLVGSIVVDDEGYVYVADPRNRRIQKFAP